MRIRGGRAYLLRILVTNDEHIVTAANKTQARAAAERRYCGMDFRLNLATREDVERLAPALPPPPSPIEVAHG